MKTFKNIFISVVLVLLMVGPVFAGGSTPSSVTASGSVVGVACQVTGLLISTNGSDDVKVELYDNASTNSGNRIAPPITIKGSDNYGGVIKLDAVAENGVYAEITTTGSTVVTVYNKRR